MNEPNIRELIEQFGTEWKLTSYDDWTTGTQTFANSGECGMVRKSSRRRRSTDITSLVDSLIDTELFSCYNEELDLETLKLLEIYEMQSTMNSVDTMPAMGQLDVGPNNTFSATFTEEGSSAIQSVSYLGEMLDVIYRSNPSVIYQYTATEDTLSDIMKEVQATLVDGEGSVGSIISRLKNSNAIQLVWYVP
jgi:hypothetical protein